jgi:hypothetical protein
MSENVQTAMFEILKRLQSDFASFRTETSERFERLEDLVRKKRRDTAGLLVMAKAVRATLPSRSRQSRNV